MFAEKYSYSQINVMANDFSTLTKLGNLKKIGIDVEKHLSANYIHVFGHLFVFGIAVESNCCLES